MKITERNLFFYPQYLNLTLFFILHRPPDAFDSVILHRRYSTGCHGDNGTCTLCNLLEMQHNAEAEKLVSQSYSQHCLPLYILFSLWSYLYKTWSINFPVIIRFVNLCATLFLRFRYLFIWLGFIAYSKLAQTKIDIKVCRYNDY